MGKDARSFNEYMSEKKIADRWLVLKAALVGAFVGAISMYAFVLFGLIR